MPVKQVLVMTGISAINVGVSKPCHFYRVMLYAQRDDATLSRPSACPSTVVYDIQVYFSHITSRLISLRFWLGLTPTSAIWFMGI